MFLRISHNYQSSYIFRTYLDIKEINVWNKWNLYINFIAHNWIHHWISCFLLFTKYRTPRLILNKFSTCFNKYSAHKMVYICFFFSPFLVWCDWKYDLILILMDVPTPFLFCWFWSNDLKTAIEKYPQNSAPIVQNSCMFFSIFGFQVKSPM